MSLSYTSEGSVGIFKLQVMSGVTHKPKFLCNPALLRSCHNDWSPSCSSLKM